MLTSSIPIQHCQGVMMLSTKAQAHRQAGAEEPAPLQKLKKESATAVGSFTSCLQQIPSSWQTHLTKDLI